MDLPWLKDFCESDERGKDYTEPESGYTLLMLVIQSGSIECVKYLVEECKVSIEQTDIWHNTAIIHASTFGKMEILKYLSEERGANMQVQNIFGATPLDCAFGNAQIEVIRYLLLGNQAYNETAVSRFFFGRFFKSACANGSCLSLKYVSLISVETFLNAKQFPVFSECASKRWHVSGDSVDPNCRILFISHRWQTQPHPDPEQKQYAIVCEFIRQARYSFDFVWLDYACITQNKEDPLFLLHIHNIPTALFCATDCLIVPMCQSTPQNECLSITDLSDYLGRGWCQVEAIVAIYTGCVTHCSYQVHSQSPKFIPLDSYKSDRFACASSTALSELNAEAGGWDQLWQGREPTQVALSFANLVIICKNRFPNIFAKMIQMELDAKSIEFLGRTPTDQLLKPYFGSKFIESYKGLGQFTDETDRLVVLNLLCFCIAYSMYDFQPEQKKEVKPQTSISESTCECCETCCMM